MLELQNVTKIYKTKAGTVKALDGVSLTFPSSGLVFITGKSGCGKTTLLNVIGGLDGIDDGEILVQDKKFSAFSASEYDSYRNTFIGFIFQEYNLLSEFSVEKNIKIAMELQGRTASEEEFEQLLKDVEIQELKNRHPAELSGGQRQRVAIARALVKHPRIIMADEPTGALDSGTGIQVLDTLKKLSKDKLVIVVSHDLEFAENYADRVIHLIDGKVAQDITYSEKELASNVSERENLLVVKDGSDLSESEKDLLAKAVKQRKKISIIEKLSYRDSAPTGKVKKDDSEPVSLHKSKMKLKSAAFLGLKSLTVKPFRLIITVLVSALAFAVFGLFDTIATFSTQSILQNALKINNAQTITVTPSYTANYQAGDSYALQLSDDAIADLAQDTGGTVKGVSKISLYSSLIDSDVVIGKKYYANSINGFIEFDPQTELDEQGNFKDFPYRLVAGKYPKLIYEDGVLVKTSMYNVAISTFLADSIIYYLNGNPLGEKTIEVREDLIGATIEASNNTYTITGLIDCGEIPAKYAPLKDATPNNVNTRALLTDYNAFIDSGAHKCFFSPKGFTKLVHQPDPTFQTGNTEWSMSLQGLSGKKQIVDYVYASRLYDENNILFFKEDRESFTLADDEILIHHANLEDVFSTEIAALADKTMQENARYLIGSMQSKNATENRETFNQLLSLLNKSITNGCFTANITQRYEETGEKVVKSLKIVGVYFGVDTSSYTAARRYKFMMNDTLMQSFGIYPKQGEYSKILFSSAAVRSGLQNIVAYLIEEEGLTLSLYNNSTLKVIRDNETMIKQVANLFLYAAIALALLAIFLLYNYISTSISSKKQSVGVLRGLGAGGKDILLTFLSESLIIALVNGILAVALSAVGCTLVNAYILHIMNVSIPFALFGARQVLVIAIITFVTAIASSALPIIKISKKKPVELIRRP